MTQASITVLGAGIAGLWQALTLARRGHRVHLCETAPAATQFAQAASAYAGGMLAPYCEEEAAPSIVREMGIEGLKHWRQAYPAARFLGSLVVAQARDAAELTRFARMTSGHQRLDGPAIAALEPGLDGRFGQALYFADEGHVVPREALAYLLAEVRRAGVDVRLGASTTDAAEAGDWLVDCRGWAARAELPELRGVRGEMAIVRTREVALARPVRMLHPRFPLYVVPWGDGRYMIGATVIERDDAGPVTLRSALELLGAAYAIHPAFGEAEIVELGAGVRPAFPDNIPKLVARGRHLYVNGMYRHGYLTAPVLARLVADYIATGTADAPPEVFVEDRRER